MTPKPRSSDPKHWGSGKLDDKRAIITGGDSSIGRAVTIAFAREGANVAFVYLDEHDGTRKTQRFERAEGRCVEAYPRDIGERRLREEVSVEAACMSGDGLPELLELVLGELGIFALE